MERFTGRVLDQRYRIDKFLGESGRGATYQGHDLESQRDVAIKILDRTYISPLEFQEKFNAWRELTARLDQPHILKPLHISLSRTGLPIFVVTDFIPGGNLSQNQAKLTLVEAIQIVRQICLVLDDAHQQGIFHKALKPENILLGDIPEGTTFHAPFLSDLGPPALTDLGLKKLLALEPRFAAASLKRTLSYLSPEQVRDETVDARTDIYALGVLLYELTVGHPPFDVETIAQAVRQHTEVAPTPPGSLASNLSQLLESIILKALAKAPAERYPSAAALAEALDSVPAGLSASTKAAKPDRRPTPGTARQTNINPPPTVISNEPPPPTTPPTASAVPSGPDPIHVAYNVQGFLRVHPGSSCSFDFTLTNQTPRDIEVHLSFEGIARTWVSDLPARLTLQPQRPQKIQIKLKPPRSPKSQAGQYQFTIRIHSPALSGYRAIIGKPLIVEPYREFTCELLPNKTRIEAGSSNRLMVRNQGNAPETFLIRWHEATGKTRFRPGRVRSQILPGKYKTFSFQALPGQFLSIGSTPLIQDLERRPFSIIVSTGDKTETIQHEVISRGLIPTRYGLLAVALILLINFVCLFGRFVISGPVIENIVLNPPEPELNQPFSASWVIEGNTWGATVELLLDTQKIKTGLNIDDEYHFISGINRPHTLTVRVANLWGLSDAKNVLLGVPPPLVDMEITPLSIAQGETVLIEWRVQNASSVSLTDSLGRSLLLDPEKFIGTLQDKPPQDVTYTLAARTLSNPPQMADESIMVEVRPRLEPFTSLMVEPQVVTLGQDPVITLTWVVDNAEAASIEPGIGRVTPCTPNVDADCINHKQIPAPSEDTIYTIIATNSAFTSTSTVELLVLEVDTPVISQFEVKPSIITQGIDEKVTITWSTNLAEIITLEPDVGLVGPFGSREVDAPSSDTVYSLIAQNGQQIVEKTVNVKVREVAPPEITFTANPEVLVINEDEISRQPTLHVTLEWDVANVDNDDQVVLTRGGDVVVSGILSGSTIDKIPAIPGPVTYVLTARNRFRQTSVAEVTVLVERQ